MRHAWMVVSALSLLNPCSKKDAAVDGDAAPAEAAAPVVVVDDDAAAAPVVVAEPVAKNVAKVARFPNDTKLGMEKDKLLAFQTIARESPGGGTVVAILAKDVEVSKVASRGDFFLVAFADPKDSASTLIGWIPKAGFSPSAAPVKTAAPIQSAARPKCRAGSVGFDDGKCHPQCTVTKDCPKGGICTSFGNGVSGCLS